MSTGRDPRVDPRPGDVVEVEVVDLKHTLSVDKVTLSIEVGGQMVYFSPSDSRMRSDLTLDDWRECTRNARVVARGQEDRDGG